MTNKQIETAREIRLWVGQIVVPAAVGGVIIMANPNVRLAIRGSINKLKRSLRSKCIKVKTEP